MRLRLGLLVVALLSVVGCTDDKAAVRVDDTGQLAAFTPNEVIELPPSPVGEWPQYNWVWLADGSGFVHAGAARATPDGIDRTLTAAYFSFEDRRYTRLPDLPVTSGVGEAGGARIGDTLVVAGQDCPPMPGSSDLGVEFCDDRANGAKVLLTLHLGDERWVTHDVPEWMEEFHWGTPTTIGVRDGRLLLASGHTPAHLAEFDPGTGEWTRLADGPARNGVPSGDGSAQTTVPGAPTTTMVIDPAGYDSRPAEYFLVGDDLVAFHVDNVYAQPPSPKRQEWWRLDGDQWIPLDHVVDGTISTASCSRHGFYVTTVPDDGNMIDADLHHVDPVAGTSTLLGHSSSGAYGVPPQVFGDTAIAAGVPELVVPSGATTTTACAASCDPDLSPSTLPEMPAYQPPPMLILTPTRAFEPPVDFDEYPGLMAFGDYLVDTGDVYAGRLEDVERTPTHIVKLDLE